MQIWRKIETVITSCWYLQRDFSRIPVVRSVFLRSIIFLVVSSYKSKLQRM